MVAHVAFCFMCGGNRVDGVRDGLSRPPHRYRQLQRQTHDQEPRALAAAVAAPLTLIFFGVLTWIALVFSFALVLPVAHMALRPRSLSARYNAASDEVEHSSRRRRRRS